MFSWAIKIIHNSDGFIVRTHQFPGLKTAQRQVILVDILGVDKLPSSFAFMLTTEGLATLIGPPVAGKGLVAITI